MEHGSKQETFVKVYLAARYSRYLQMQKVRNDLMAIGFSVTSRWIEGGHQMSKEGSTEAQQLERIRFAQEDWSDLMDAHLVLNFTEEPRTTKTRGGRHVELGAALASGKHCCVIGWRENVFHSLPEIDFFETWSTCLEALKTGSSICDNPCPSVAKERRAA